ncbi:MAG: glycerol-3-phosphate 1-O-acyltransferase PlsY [Candidatus Acetothermia bacterium]
MACVSYLIGSIPFSYLIPKVTRGKDIRDHGSGNIGASNVSRVCGVQYGLAALVLDVGKGAAAAGLAGLLGFPQVLGAAAILGHISTPFLGFSGGKGVATSIGVIAVFSWQTGLIAAGIWITLLALTRTASVSSIGALGLAPVVLRVLGIGDLRLWLTIGIFALIIFTHRENIARIIRGEEKTVV